MLSKLNLKVIALWLTIIMIISFAAVGVIFATQGVSGIFPNLKDHNINVENILSVDGIKNIDISTIDENINIIPVDDKEVKVRFYGIYTTNTNNIPELVAQNAGSEMSIHIKHKPHIGININYGELKLDVYVPKAYTENLNIHVVSANSNIDNIGLDHLKYTSVSGELKARGLKSENSEISTTSGNADLEDFTGNLDFHSVSGDLDVTYANFDNNIDATTTSGSVDAKLPATAEFEIKYNTVSGSFKSDFALTQEEGKPWKRGTQGTVGNGKNKVTIKTVSGDLEISK